MIQVPDQYCSFYYTTNQQKFKALQPSRPGGNFVHRMTVYDTSLGQLFPHFGHCCGFSKCTKNIPNKERGWYHILYVQFIYTHFVSYNILYRIQ